MTILYLDTETYSECDLRTAGTHRYAEHESTEITVAQWALDDAEPTVFDCTVPLAASAPPDRLYNLLRDPTIKIVAHNSHFDRTVIRHVWGLDLPPERWHDTMVQAMCHGLPGGLGKLGPALGIPLDMQKDKRGAQLIQLFCKPRPKNSKILRATHDTHPTEWQEFLEYSRQDIVSMREIYKRLPKWNYQGAELALWHLDQRINDRGFLVDMDLARAAIETTDAEKVKLKKEAQEATDGLVTSLTKRDELLTFLLSHHGVTLPDLKGATLRALLDEPDLDSGLRDLVLMRIEATKTSTAKYQALVKATSSDCRLRNTLQFAGASRTARWAGRIFQPQNMPRPSSGFDEHLQEECITALKGGYASLGGDVMQLTSDCIRGSIIASEGKKFCVADLANIEGRMLAWLAGEEWKLQAFRDYDTYLLDEFGARIPEKDDFKRVGHDLYKLAYARSFNIDPKDAVGQKRQIGKVMELGLGYEGGVAAFLTFAATYHMDLDKLADAVHSTAPKESIAAAYKIHEWAIKKGMAVAATLPRNVFVACEVLKTAWRDAHPKTKALWAEAKDSTIAAIKNPGNTFDIGPHLRARVDGHWLRIRLPSGRYLCYLQPQVDDAGTISYMGVNQFTRQWTRIKTYGGKFIENADQAASRDVLAANMQPIEDEGYLIVLTVHDELITEVGISSGLSNDKLSSLMSVTPVWADGLPLAAAGFEALRYRKD